MESIKYIKVCGFTTFTSENVKRECILLQATVNTKMLVKGHMFADRLYEEAHLFDVIY